jgi:hypothetical protein
LLKANQKFEGRAKMITLQQAAKAILAFPPSDTPCLLGAPGIGKSSIVAACAKAMKAELITVYPVLRDVVDAKGLPYVIKRGNSRVTQWAVPSEFPVRALQDKFPANKPILLFLDDLFQAAPAVQNALSRAFFERVIGESELMENVRVIVAGNRDSDRAATFRAPSYVNDRLTFLEVEPSGEEWVRHTLNIRSEIEVDFAAMSQRIKAALQKPLPEFLVAYVQWAGRVNDFDPNRRSNLSPRSLERAGRIIQAFEVGLDGSEEEKEAILNEALGGTIGADEAAKLMAFRKKAKELPDIGALLRGEEVPLPTRTELLYMTAVAALQRAEKEHVPGLAKLIRRLGDLVNEDKNPIAVEVSAFLFSAAQKKLPALRTQKDIAAWLCRHHKILS